PRTSTRSTPTATATSRPTSSPPRTSTAITVGSNRSSSKAVHGPRRLTPGARLCHAASRMRLLIALAALAAAAAAHAAPIGYDGARHLLDRTGFGATDREVREFAALDREHAVDRLLAGTRREAITTAPAFATASFEPYLRLKDMDPEDRKAYVRKLTQEGLELRAWWIGEMLATPSPLTERMTLFWHNHFATSQRKVRLGQLMYRQNVLLRREALGNFGTLLHGIAKDPAMLVWLDNAGSRRQAPNENFAREVMELF